MIELQTALEGQQARFGDMREIFSNYGFDMGGNWDYHKGSFDCTLWRDSGESIYIRVPFVVLDGELDHPNAYIQFQKPYVIKHVVNIGLDTDEQSLLAATGFNQFQDPVDTDAQIEQKNKWEHEGEQLIQRIMQHFR